MASYKNRILIIKCHRVYVSSSPPREHAQERSSRLLEVAKSGLKGGLQSSTPRLWVAFDAARCLWWPQPRRNVAHPPSSLTRPPELWNAARAASPAGMGLERRHPMAPWIPSFIPMPASVDNTDTTLSRSKIWDQILLLNPNRVGKRSWTTRPYAHLCMASTLSLFIEYNVCKQDWLSLRGCNP